MSGALTVNETFYSIQGEGIRAGMPCVFVRLTGCHLRCHYCDTAYAFHEGQQHTINQIVGQVEQYHCDLVEVTGGEPLLQPNVHALMSRLCDLGKTVLIETSGTCDIAVCDPRVIRIMDIKTPASGQVHRNCWANIDHLAERDEVKFVICGRQDYEWTRNCIRKHDIAPRVAAVLLSPASFVESGPDIAGVDGLALHDLTQWVLQDQLPVRVQIQLHKLIWDPLARGV